jgi:hypothetical protein
VKLYKSKENEREALSATDTTSEQNRENMLRVGHNAMKFQGYLDIASFIIKRFLLIITSIVKNIAFNIYAILDVLINI